MGIGKETPPKKRTVRHKKRYDLRTGHVPKKAPKAPKARSRRPPPPQSILDKKIADDSREANLYTLNQQNSPLLQLPAEIRSIIYGYVLGGTKIHVERLYWKTGKPKLPCRSLGSFTYPSHRHREMSRESLTLLNNLCRQLYKETAVLPYSLNIWAFGSIDGMKWFTGHDDHSRPFHPHRKAIKTVLALFNPRGSSLLTYMGGIKSLLHRLHYPHDPHDQIRRYKIENRKRRWYSIRAGEAPFNESLEWDHERLMNSANEHGSKGKAVRAVPKSRFWLDM
ncbi:hypothetical protein K491DRAFT_723594 [Lophiostoma macrostomum CBS 122681]|uniref:DUF7730 domain-containing protein n=1 Tax=Lophiostoma macrostomum CBS 122681 TaxID=1314788 RepID=A0A6A6SJU8_9PLEO|nr:hypothetical protein K491DRAFT_723594 [Lophiostoma macrostomum CBS 122681]